MSPSSLAICAVTVIAIVALLPRLLPCILVYLEKRQRVELLYRVLREVVHTRSVEDVQKIAGAIGVSDSLVLAYADCLHGPVRETRSQGSVAPPQPSALARPDDIGHGAPPTRVTIPLQARRRQNDESR